MLVLKINESENLEKLEPINESLVASGSKISIHVTADPNRNIGVDSETSMAYFKVGNNPSFRKSTKVVRISFLDQNI